MTARRDRRVLVTGASGFLGRHLLPRLEESGARIRGLFRRAEQVEAARAEGVEAFLGDVTDPASLPPAVSGATHVLHLAALVGGRRGDHDRVNRAGTENLVRATNEAAPDLERFVLVSSIAAVGPDRGGGLLTERSPPRPVSPYGRSKLAQEEVLASRARFPWCAVRPPLLYGPSDRLTLPLFRIAARGWLPSFAGGLRRASMLHVRDAARAVLRAAEAEGVEGRRILLTGPGPVTPPSLRRALERALGRKVRLVALPIPLLEIPDGILAALRGDGFLGHLAHPRHEADAEEARRLLGFVAEVRLEDGVAETVRWYREAGWL